jgi:rhodanese-related sulfurtransferase
MVVHAKRSRDAVTIHEAKTMMDAGALMLDVRAPERYARRPRRRCYETSPCSSWAKRRRSSPPTKDRPIVCVCDVGNISANGMLYLKSFGYSNVKSLSGGTQA